MQTRLLFLLFLLIFTNLNAQGDYPGNSQLEARIKALSAGNRFISSQSTGKSAGGKELWVLKFSKPESGLKPAILIVAGADGKHAAGTEITLRIAENLSKLSIDSLNSLLSNRTIFLMPQLNPDAFEHLIKGLKYERSGNAASTDDDRDGRFDEDPFEDLNGDGMITQIRLEDPTGNYIINKKESRLLIKADPAKGEVGKYILITEGTDNDKDGEFNEDGPGGVNIDKNFTYDYPIFEREAGAYQASEPETRALLDFLYKNTNIHSVFTFGLADNLSEAPKFDKLKATKKIISGLLENDASVGDFVSKMYTSKTKPKDAPRMPLPKGNLSQTAYYHAGRFSFITPGWWVPRIEEPKDSTKKETPKGPATKREMAELELDFLKWADKEKLYNGFVSWKTIKHPDFEGKVAEVGGIAPNALFNPPVRFLDTTAIRHQMFFTEFLKSMPDVQLVNAKVEQLQGGVNRVTVQVVNKGLLPTYAEIGDKIRFINKVRTDIRLADGQQLIAGKKSNFRGALKAGETAEYSWLISGKGKVIIEAGCPTAGIKNIELTLK